MKKVVAYVGSRKREKSNTYFFTKCILEKVKEKEKDIQYEILTPNDFNILPCDSCNNCFKFGNCILDKKDQMGSLRQKLIEADFIILGSPIYAHHVSGDLKVMIDRCSYWLHLMRLAGKGSMALTTSMSNGHATGIEYLEKILINMGSKFVAKYNAGIEYPEQLFHKEWMNETTEILSDVIINTIQKPIESDKNLEALFNNLKQIMLLYRENKIHPGEVEFWEKSGFLECNSFSEVLLKYN